MIDGIYSKYHGIEDEKWLKIILASIRENTVDGTKFPEFPDEQIQISFVGGANENTINEIWPYYRTIRSIAQKNGIVFDENTRLLDVGSGWGRVIRFFLKDIHASNLYGIDTMQSSVSLCNKLFDNALNFSSISTMPPTDFKDGWFDIIEGYSVLSHLSRHSGLMWLDEYHRILKPGGLLAMTVWKTTHFEFITEWQRTMKNAEGYRRVISQMYTAGCATERKIFNALGFDYKSYGGGIEGNEEITYGEAIMSPDYIKKYWCRSFDFVDYVDSSELAQALVVLQKPRNSDAASCVDELRKEQYDMLKQLDLLNGISREIATGSQSSDLVAETSPSGDDGSGSSVTEDLRFTPAFGYKKLAINHAKAGLKAFRDGLVSKFKSR